MALRCFNGLRPPLVVNFVHFIVSLLFLPEENCCSLGIRRQK